MKNKHTLDEMLHELLIELNVESGSVIEARDLLLDKFKSAYNSLTLYKVIHQRLRRLEALNLIEMTTLNDPGPVSFKIKAEFRSQNFVYSKSLNNSRKKRHRIYENKNSDDSLITMVRERIKKADCHASKLRVLEEQLKMNKTDLNDAFDVIIDLWLNSCHCCYKS